MAEKNKMLTDAKAVVDLSAERIAHLESEIAAKKAEICQLQLAARGGEARSSRIGSLQLQEKNQDETHLTPMYKKSSNGSLELDELAGLWEERLASMKKQQHAKKGISASAIHDAFRDPVDEPVPPGLVYTSSIDSDETRDGPPELTSPLPSPRNLFDNLQNSFVSPRGVDGLDFHFDEPDVQGKETSSECVKKIEHLKAFIDCDTELIRKMKGTIQKLVQEKTQDGSKSSLKMIVGELESTISLQDMQNEILKEECTRLQDVIAGLESSIASKENIIMCMKAEMVKQQFTNRMAEEELRAELAQRDVVIANLESSFKENADNSKRMIKALGVQSSLLEDEIENLKAENGRLQAQSQVLEEEKRVGEERLDREMQLLYIEKEAMAGYHM